MHGIWIGRMASPIGLIEVIVDGTPEQPDVVQLQALQAFLPQAASRVVTLRRRLSLSFLYSPIRIAVNRENRVGVQYRNRLTGSRILLMSDE